jgi:hypothetical protein
MGQPLIPTGSLLKTNHDAGRNPDILRCDFASVALRRFVLKEFLGFWQHWISWTGVSVRRPALGYAENQNPFFFQVSNFEQSAHFGTKRQATMD